ncbi:hypothetical protein HDU93_009211 [Gonapodya sp. JEL0774]|nr:hypothetical protein HDU93_009211 [Gonapodya sp. JEL0774]
MASFFPQPRVEKDLPLMRGDGGAGATPVALGSFVTATARSGVTLDVSTDSGRDYDGATEIGRNFTFAMNGSGGEGPTNVSNDISLPKSDMSSNTGLTAPLGGVDIMGEQSQRPTTHSKIEYTGLTGALPVIPPLEPLRSIQVGSATGGGYRLRAVAAAANGYIGTQENGVALKAVADSASATAGGHGLPVVELCQAEKASPAPNENSHTETSTDSSSKLVDVQLIHGVNKPVEALSYIYAKLEALPPPVHQRSGGSRASSSNSRSDIDASRLDHVSVLESATPTNPHTSVFSTPAHSRRPSLAALHVPRFFAEEVATAARVVGHSGGRRSSVLGSSISLGSLPGSQNLGSVQLSQPYIPGSVQLASSGLSQNSSVVTAGSRALQSHPESSQPGMSEKMDQALMQQGYGVYESSNLYREAVGVAARNTSEGSLPTSSTQQHPSVSGAAFQLEQLASTALAKVDTPSAEPTVQSTPGKGATSLGVLANLYRSTSGVSGRPTSVQQSIAMESISETLAIVGPVVEERAEGIVTTPMSLEVEGKSTERAYGDTDWGSGWRLPKRKRKPGRRLVSDPIEVGSAGKDWEWDDGGDSGERLKRYVRKGIPPEIRGRAWLEYSGASSFLIRNPGFYEHLLNLHGERPHDDPAMENPYMKPVHLDGGATADEKPLWLDYLSKWKEDGVEFSEVVENSVTVLERG